MGVLLFLLGLAPGPPLTSGEVRVSRTADRLHVAAPDAPEVPSEDDRMMMRRRFREGMERPPGMERPAGADNKTAEPADARPAENEPAAGEPGIARPLQLPTPPADGAGRNRMGGPGRRRNGGGQQQQPH